jgi:hypothetical protein
MNVLAKQWGVEHMMPLQKARYIVMKEPAICREGNVDDGDEHVLVVEDESEQIRSFRPCHILKALTDNIDPYDYDCDSDIDDDYYYSNSSLEEEETSCSSDSSSDDMDMNHHRSVTFCTPLVTACYIRPITTADEKYELYYTDIEYRDFRRNYVIYNRIQQCRWKRNNNKNDKNESIRRRKNTTIVQFHTDVITDIYTIPSSDNASELYYSRPELQGYVYSLVIYTVTVSQSYNM